MLPRMSTERNRFRRIETTPDGRVFEGAALVSAESQKAAAGDLASSQLIQYVIRFDQQACAHRELCSAAREIASPKSCRVPTADRRMRISPPRQQDQRETYVLAGKPTTKRVLVGRTQ